MPNVTAIQGAFERRCWHVGRNHFKNGRHVRSNAWLRGFTRACDVQDARAVAIYKSAQLDGIGLHVGEVRKHNERPVSALSQARGETGPAASLTQKIVGRHARKDHGGAAKVYVFTRALGVFVGFGFSQVVDPRDWPVFGLAALGAIAGMCDVVGYGEVECGAVSARLATGNDAGRESRGHGVIVFKCSRSDCSRSKAGH